MSKIYFCLSKVLIVPPGELLCHSLIGTYTYSFDVRQILYQFTFLISIVTGLECVLVLIRDKGVGRTFWSVRCYVNHLMYFSRTESSLLIKRDLVRDEVWVDCLFFFQGFPSLTRCIILTQGLIYILRKVFIFLQIVDYSILNVPDRRLVFRGSHVSFSFYTEYYSSFQVFRLYPQS